MLYTAYFAIDCIQRYSPYKFMGSGYKPEPAEVFAVILYSLSLRQERSLRSSIDVEPILKRR